MRIGCTIVFGVAVGTALAQPTVRVLEGDLGPGLDRSLWGHYFQGGGKFGSADRDPVTIGAGTAAHAGACQPNCATVPWMDAVASGCGRPERFSFEFWRRELRMGTQKLWLDPGDITGLACGPCRGSESAIVECQMRTAAASTEQSMERDAQGRAIPGTGFVGTSYHQMLAGSLHEGLQVFVAFRAPVKQLGAGCSTSGLACSTDRCLDELRGLVRGFYEYVRRNSAGLGNACEPACDLPSDSLNRIIFGLTPEPDLGKSMGYFGPFGYDEWGKQLDALLSVPYPVGFRRRVAGPDLTTRVALDDQSGTRAAWLGVVRNRVDYVTYHGLYCGSARNWDANYLLPATLRAELGTSQPLWCTEWANNEILNRAGPCGGTGCGGSSPPDCGTNKLDEGMLDMSIGLLHQSRSGAGLLGVLMLGVFEGHGVACGGSSGAGLIGNTTRDIDPTTPAKEMFIQGPSATHHAVRLIMRDLAGDGSSGSRVLPSTAPGTLVEAARLSRDGTVTLVVVNRGPQQSVILDWSALQAIDDPVRVVTRVVAPSHRDASGTPSPMLDVVTSDGAVSGRSSVEVLLADSITSFRIGGRIPRIDRLDPPWVPSNEASQVRLFGEGLASGDTVRLGEKAGALRDCTAGHCLFDIPPRELPVGADREVLSVWVSTGSSSAESNHLDLVVVDPPSICRWERPPVPGVMAILDGFDLAGSSEALLFDDPGCTGLPRHRVPLGCLETGACGRVDSQRGRLLIPAGFSALTSGGVLLRRPYGGEWVVSPCLPLPVEPGPVPLDFCVEAGGLPCSRSAVGSPDAEGGPGTLFTFRVSRPRPGATYEWDLADGSAETGAAIQHRYGAATPLGGLTITVRESLAGCPEVRSVADAVYLGRAGELDLVTGPGRLAGNPARMRGFGLSGGVPRPLDLFAYGVGDFGLEVARSGLSSGPTTLTGPGPGTRLGPHVRGFGPEGESRSHVNFYAYGTLRYGVHPAAARLGIDAWDVIVTGAGAGSVFGPHVRAFRASGPIEPVVGINFHAYRTLKWGVEVTGGDIDGGVGDEIVTGPGPGPRFGPEVRGFLVDEQRVAGLGLSFMAGTGSHGVEVASVTSPRPGGNRLVTGSGPSPNRWGEVSVFGPPHPSPGQRMVPFPTRYGVRVGGAVVWDEARVLAGPGADPTAAPRVRGFDLDFGAVLDLLPYRGLPYRGGASVAGSTR